MWLLLLGGWGCGGRGGVVRGECGGLGEGEGAAAAGAGAGGEGGGWKEGESEGVAEDKQTEYEKQEELPRQWWWHPACRPWDSSVAAAVDQDDDDICSASYAIIGYYTKPGPL